MTDSNGTPPASPEDTSQADDEGSVDPASSQLPFCVVGLGSSAGGIQALSSIFDKMPAEPDMALVIVQHMDPEHRSELASLLDASNLLPVLEIEDGTKVETNHVYVMPPSKGLLIEDGCLRLEPREEDGHGYVIDRFFSSLAKDQGERAIGMLLSGTLTDGVVGLRRIRERGGTVIVQDPKTAAFDGMPRAAIDAGLADFVLAPEQMGAELTRITQHPYPRGSTEAEDEWPKDILNDLFHLLRNRTSIDFQNYKRTTLKRRIHRRMMATHENTLEAYVDHVRQNPQELDHLQGELLILVTQFFRDPELFDVLQEEIFDKLVASTDPEEKIRLWVPGCSTGEEAYSLAMTLVEYLEDHGIDRDAQIFATDVSQEAIATAREGAYAPGIETEIPAPRLKRFFIETEDGYRVNDTLRGMCVFSIHDLTSDPPFSNIHLVSCRNVAIYMDPSLQERVFSRFHYALSPDGYLVLGPSESPGRASDLYEALDYEHQIYQAREAEHADPLDLGIPEPSFDRTPALERPESGQPSQPPSRGKAIQTLLDRFVPPALVVTNDKEIREFIGETGRYLTHPPGAATKHVLKLAREGLAPAIGQALDEAENTEDAVRKTHVPYEAPTGHDRTTVEVIPLTDPASGYLIIFLEDADHERTTVRSALTSAWSHLERVIPPGGSGSDRVEELEDELTSTREYLRSVIEQYEATNEELRSANEEALSANEELQATNEELETAKEELQATNEELVTLNDELEQRNREMQQVNDDLENLLSSVKLPIVMVDQNLKIRRFTPDAKKLFNLIGSDTGRPLTDMNLPLDEDELEHRMLRVLEDLEEDQFEVEDQNGREYRLKLEAYRTSDNQIDGVVLVVLGPPTEES